MSTWVLVACLCICCGGVTCVSIWFIRERWNYFQFSKQQRAQYEWHWSESLRRKRVAWRGFRHKQLLTFTTLSRVIAQMAFKINNVYWRAHDLLEGVWRRFYSIFPDWKSRRRSNLWVNLYHERLSTERDLIQASWFPLPSSTTRHWSTQTRRCGNTNYE